MRTSFKREKDPEANPQTSEPTPGSLQGTHFPECEAANGKEVKSFERRALLS
jgi:hypothetical protein